MFRSAVLMLLSALPSLALAQQRPAVDERGAISGPAQTAPLSEFTSPEFQKQFVESLRAPLPPGAADGIEARRAFSDANAKQSLEGWLKIYPSRIENTVIDGVRTDVVTPASGIDPKNAKRVLINAHMGGFTTGGKYGGQIEAVPLAGHGKIKIIAVDYRMAPEHKFPAASEDMEKVYRDALKTTKPENIGLYGCSAGGTLTGQSIAWFKAKGLPLPGAIAIMCSGLMKSFWFGGDSGTVNALFNAAPQRPAPTGAPTPYLDGINLDDPLVTPGLYPDTLKIFPPTLMVTGTRDVAMSNVLATHNALKKAGVRAELLVQDGLGHGHFFTFPGTPEAALAYDVIWAFFDRNLAR